MDEYEAHPSLYDSKDFPAVSEAPEESTKETGNALKIPGEDVEIEGRGRGGTIGSVLAAGATIRNECATCYEDDIAQLQHITQRKLMILTAFYQMVTIKRCFFVNKTVPAGFF